MTNFLPTMQDVSWAVTHFHDSLISLLRSEQDAIELRLYFYAVTSQGWLLIRKYVQRWQRRQDDRRVVAYVGTDHGITDANALKTMQDDGVSIRLLLHHIGVYHPKVIWFYSEEGGGILLVGSNNLTQDGLIKNVEFATLTRFDGNYRQLTEWHDFITTCSVDLTDELIRSYQDERERFGAERATNHMASTFTWSRRTDGRDRQGPPARPTRGLRNQQAGDLILEIMDRETGTGGSQIQIPRGAAELFYGLPNELNATIQVHLRNAVTREDRTLTMRLYSNHTTRLVIHELEYRDRPCLIVLRRFAPSRFNFEIIRQSMEPGRYRDLISRCKRTRIGSRRWTITT